MTKKQANTLMGLCVAMILTQILCTTLILRSLERAGRVTVSTGYSARNTAVMMQCPKASVQAAQTSEKATAPDPRAAAPSPQQEGQQFVVILLEPPEPSAPAEESKVTRPFEDVKPDHWAYAAVTDRMVHDSQTTIGPAPAEHHEEER